MYPLEYLTVFPSAEVNLQVKFEYFFNLSILLFLKSVFMNICDSMFEGDSSGETP